MAKIELPPALQNFTKGNRKLQTPAKNLDEAIQFLELNFPGIKCKLVSSQGEILRFVSIFVDNEDVRYQEGLQTKLQPDSLVLILVAMAGG